jgi:predicted nucleic acid-binding protein
MNIKYSLADIPSLTTRRVFFDTNVLIYIFWPSGAYHWEKYYSKAFSLLIRQHNELLVDFIVISEIVNRASRLEYDKYLLANNFNKKDISFKQYRNSIEGQATLSDIHLIIETNILSNFSVVGKSFTNFDIQLLLTVDTLDFTDKGILLTCKENDCILLTNDIDFKSTDIDILTSNPKFSK